ncbi:MAG: alkene reductase [Phycisphaerales bacterium]
MSTPDSILLKPLTTDGHTYSNRVWMAPLTRSRATMPGNIPNDMMATYYAQRAGSGLIIAEATPVSPTGHGYYATPGIHTEEQELGWCVVTDAVHEKGGKIFLQLWHVGRVSHSALQPNNQPPIGPTDVASESQTYLDHTMERHPNTACRALETGEIPEIVEDFARATRFAKAAGFDGVEIHGANSYLLDQFTRDGINTRNDEYGGSLENRLKFPLMVAKAVVDAWGDPSGVGYRIAPLSEHKDVRDSDPEKTFCALAAGLGALNLEYLHAVETWDRTSADPRIQTVIPAIVKSFKDHGGKLYIGNGDYSVELAEQAIDTGWCDAVAFGKLWIPNPDFEKRIAQNGPYRAPDRETFYGGGPEGYINFEPLTEAEVQGAQSQ